MNKIIGIYKITSPSGKIYIGQSIDIYNRWIKGHKYSNSRKIGVGKKLKNSYIKYGHENHKFEIIEECSTEQLNEREIYWINFYNSYKNGLNSTDKPKYFGEHSKEWKLNQSKGLKGRKCVWEGKKRPEHSKLLKEKGSGFSYKRTEKHKNNTSKIIKEVWNNKKEEISKKITQNKIGKGTKSVICETLYGIKFNSVSEAGIALGISIGNISHVCNKKIIHIKGFTFRYC